MQIPTTLLVDSPEILGGLFSGELTRYGSVIRRSLGTEGAGQIVRHLAEDPGFTNQLISKAGSFVVAPHATVAAAVADVVVNTAGHAMTQNKLAEVTKSLSQVMGMSQIAAGASVLNVGISLVGFAYMGYKLNQVQKSLGHLQQTMDTGFQRVEARLDNISGQMNTGFTVVLRGLDSLENKIDTVSGQLAYLYLLVEDSRQKQESLSKAVSNLHKALLIKEIADLQSELNDLARFPGESPRQALKTTSRVRLFLSSQALQSTPELDAELMLNTDVAIQGWAVAIATEAHLLLEIGKHQEARQLLAEEVPKFQTVAHNWGRSLISSNYPTLGTAYRFSATPFNGYIEAEKINRINQVSASDTLLNADQIRQRKNEIEVEFQMSYAQTRYNQTWIYQQIAVAEYLDTLSELTARLDSLQSFAALCETTGVKSSKELLPDENSKPGLYLLPSE